MKKIMTLVFAAALVVTMTGCTKKQQGQGTSDDSGEQATKQEEQKEKSSMIENIKDAMSSGKKMKCVYTVQQDGGVFQSEAFVEGDKYKSTVSFNNQKTNSVYDGKLTYTWTDQTKQGMKMDMECVEEMGESMEVPDEDEMVEEEIHRNEDPFGGAVDVKCEKVGSIDFSIPTDVEFVDQCELMKNQQKQMEQMMKSMPQGVEIPSLQ